ncbi:MAG: hypothetical protein ABI838_01135 [Chloroflexota bacterium]
MSWPKSTSDRDRAITAKNAYLIATSAIRARMVAADPRPAPRMLRASSKVSVTALFPLPPTLGATSSFAEIPPPKGHGMGADPGCGRVLKGLAGMDGNRTHLGRLISDKTAWYLCHCIRAVMVNPNPEPLGGIVGPVVCGFDSRLPLPGRFGRGPLD